MQNEDMMQNQDALAKPFDPLAPMAPGEIRVRDDVSDPVVKDTAGFWFYEETWADKHGPYETEAQCRAELARYAELML